MKVLITVTVEVIQKVKRKSSRSSEKCIITQLPAGLFVSDHGKFGLFFGCQAPFSPFSNTRLVAELKFQEVSLILSLVTNRCYDKVQDSFFRHSVFQGGESHGPRLLWSERPPIKPETGDPDHSSNIDVARFRHVCDKQV